MTQVSGNPSYYEVLGIARTATAHEVKSAYRRLSRQIHPDAGGNGALFHLVATAYETLSDPSRRTAYDLSLMEVVEVPPALSAEPTVSRRRYEGRVGVRRAPTSYADWRLRRRRVATGAVVGALWYLLRATGLMSWVMGSRGAGRWLPATVESWARPLTFGKLLLCVAIGGAVASSRRVSRMARWVRSIRRSWVRGSLYGLLLTTALLLEHLVSVQGRRAVVIGVVLGAVVSELLRRRSGTAPGDR